MKWLFSSIFGIGGLIFMLVGCPFLAVAAGTYYFIDYRTRDWVTVTGTVTGMSISETTNSDGYTSDTYCPDVEFTTTDGATFDVSTNDCSSPPAFAVGDPIELKYNPENPEEVQLRGGALTTISTIFTFVFGGLGAVFACGGLIAILIGIVVVLRRTSTV